jgi:hypothetical protein
MTDADAGSGKSVTVTVSLSDNNYSLAANTVVTTVNIAKAAAVTLPAQNILHDSSSTSSETISVAGLMPGDAGALTYAEVAKTDANSIISTWSVDTSGLVSYTLAGGADTNTAILPVIITSTNYENSTVDVVITLTGKSIPVISADNISKTYDGIAIAIDSILNRTATFSSADVAGTWSFDGSYNLTDANSGIPVIVKFTPQDGTTYEAVSTTITVTIDKAAQSAPGGVGKTDETAASANDGTITGVTAAMEYKLSGAGSYTAVTGTNITGLAPGTYNVRYAAKPNYDAGADVNVTIAPYTTYTLTVNNGTGGGSYAATTVVPITANAPPSGQVFDKWTVTGGGSFANANSATTTFTMPANAATVTATYKPTGGGGGGGGGGASPPEQQPTATVPAAEGKAQVTYTPDGKKALLELPTDKIDEIIAKSRGGIADIDLSGVKDISEAQLPAAAIDQLAENEMSLSIYLPQGEVTLNAEALEALSKAAKGNDIVTKVESLVPAENLNARQRAVVGDRPVYDISVLCNGVAIHNFSGGLITISIPYTLQPGEMADGIRIYYLDSNGNIRQVDAVYDAKTQTAIFTTDHLSIYYIDYEVWVNPFADVFEDDWFYSDVEFASRNGLFNGTSETTFSPHMATTRGMIVTVLYRLAGSPDVSALANPFSDVASGQYYTDAVKWAAKNGIVLGIGENKFAPDEDISRQDLAVILNRYAVFANLKLPAARLYVKFSDDADIADYAKEAIEAFFKANIVSGKGDGIFDPKGTATRAEVAAMLHRFIESAE